MRRLLLGSTGDEMTEYAVCSIHLLLAESSKFIVNRIDALEDVHFIRFAGSIIYNDSFIHLNHLVSQSKNVYNARFVTALGWISSSS